MINLYWKTKGQMTDVEERPFQNEAEFEQFIYNNQGILGGDISILHRQIRTGSKQGIPDMLGVDQDSRICIIELKNEEAEERILPQALQYAIWAETNPDSIRAIWLESKQKPDGIVIDWDNFVIRIVLIAPAFKQGVLRMTSKIGYRVDLVQVRRYSQDQDEFILVEVLEETIKKVGPTKVPPEQWTWEIYESEHGKEATGQFRKMVEMVDTFAKKQNWTMRFKLNKYYTGFMSGNRVVFSVSWGGTYTWHLKLKVPESKAITFKGKCWEFQRYDNSFNEALFRPLKAEHSELGELEPLFKSAYEGVTGKKLPT